MKGILKTFEAIVGLTLVMLTFVTMYTGQDPLPEFDTVSWKTSGMEGLQSLDHSNELRYDAMNNNTGALEGRLSGYLPASVDLMVQVCGETCEVPDIDAEKSVTVQYLISGEAGNSTEKEVILYVWSDE